MKWQSDQHLPAGKWADFGAELACTGWSTSPVCLRADSDCTVLRLDFSALMSQQTMTCPCRMQVTANLMQDMAQQLLFFNTKVRILAQKRLRDRLKIYLQTLTPDEKGLLQSALHPDRTGRFSLCGPQCSFP